MLSAFSTYYTGNTARRLGRNDRQFVLQPGQSKTIYDAFSLHLPGVNLSLICAGESMQIRVTWEEYRDKVVDYGMVKFYALANVLETKQTWSEEDDFQWEKPKLDIQVPSFNFFSYKKTEPTKKVYMTDPWKLSSEPRMLHDIQLLEPAAYQLE